ncbi:MAG: TonB-dependent receptor [Tannerella sp.]|nr:TonB-dependent receptor [Tannerella sp.]
MKQQSHFKRKERRLHRLLCLLCILCMGTLTAFGQKRVNGTVTDATGEAVIGANVVERGTTNGSITDIDGKFSLNVTGSNAVLQISFVGYVTQEIVVGNQTTLNITLKEDAQALEEVVVVAYGTAKKKDLTGSVTSVDTKVIGIQSQSTVTRALEGVVPGLQVTAVDGQPGIDMGIRVRGMGTAEQSQSNALIVIDGIPVETSIDAVHSNPLSTINPKDIASITVLKDAASTALYGSRGANGVVLITTKRGATGKAKVTVEARWGINQPGPNILQTISDPKDVYEYVWQMNYNSYRFGANGNGGSLNYSTNVQTPNVTHEEAALFASQHLFDYNGTATFQRNAQLGNWMLYRVPGAIYTPTSAGTSNESATMSGAYLVNPDGKLNPDAIFLGSDTYQEHVLQNRFRQEYNIGVSGGNEKVDYNVSLGYLQDPSFIKTSHFQRYSGRANVNANAFSWLKVGANLAYAHRTTNSPPNRSGEGRNMGDNNENVFAVMYGQNQLTQLYARDENWNYIYDDNGNKVVHKSAGDTWSPLGPTGANYYSLGNWDILYVMENDIDQQVSDNYDTKVYADIYFLKDFTFTTSVSLNKYYMDRTKYRNGTMGRSLRLGFPGMFGKEEWGTTNLNAQQLLNYNHDFGKHHVTAMVGHEFNEYSRQWMTYRSTHELVPGYMTYINFVGHYTGDRMSEPGGGADKFAMESFLGNANYVYDNKYYASASLRRDGSSKFKYTDTRWGTFWSVGGGWRVSGEEFMKGTEAWLNNLKLRASYGIIGNQNGVPTYATYQTWSYAANYQTSSNGQGVPSSYRVSPNSYVNEYLTWENNHTTDIGIEFDLFNIIHGTFDWYNRDNVNGIINQPIATSLGQSSIAKNVAQIRNTGFEIELGIDAIKKKDFSWTISLNGTHYNTIMLKLPEGLGSDELDGGQLAGVSAWSAAGQTGGTDNIMLRATGKPYFNSYLYHYAGVDQATGLPLFYHKVSQEDHDNGKFTDTPVGGGVNTTDYTIASRYEQGDVLPDWIGGFNTTISYKNFDFTTVLSYQIGGLFFRRDFMYFHYSNELQRDGYAIGVSEDLIGNTWTPTNTNAKFPMAMYYGGNGYGSGAIVPNGWTDLAQFDASYLSLKNVTIGYNLPKKWLHKTGLSNLRVFVEGDNLLLFAATSGIDPRMDLTGGFSVDNYVYPFLRTYTVGLNIDF